MISIPFWPPNRHGRWPRTFPTRWGPRSSEGCCPETTSSPEWSSCCNGRWRTGWWPNRAARVTVCSPSSVPPGPMPGSSSMLVPVPSALARRLFRPSWCLTSSHANHDPEILDQALKLASQALTLPRKMLSNALPREIENSMIEAAGLEPTQRPGTVPLEGWMRLAERS